MKIPDRICGILYYSFLGEMHYELTIQLMPRDGMSYDRLLMYSKLGKNRYAMNIQHEGF